MSHAAPTLNRTESLPAHDLTTAELEAFAAKGWVLKRALFGRELIGRLSAEIDGLHERMRVAAPEAVGVSWEDVVEPGRPARIRQLMCSEMVSPIIDAMSRSPEMLAVMRQLIGVDVQLFHSKLMMKAAHDGTFTPWHQDFGYWQTTSKLPSQINCMLAIDAADEENGAIRFVDGSHRGGLVPHSVFESNSFNRGLEGGLDAFEATLVPMQPGDALFFGPLVIHGSGPNRSARDRRANTFAFDQADNQLEKLLPAESWRCGRAETRLAAKD